MAALTGEAEMKKKIVCLVLIVIGLILVCPAAMGADKDDYPDIRSNTIKNAFKVSDKVYPGFLLWPIPGQEPLEKLTCHVGWRDAKKIHDNQEGTWASWVHHGIDVSTGKKKLQVLAAAPGKAITGYGNGWGNYVIIDHGNGWYTKYQHLDRNRADD